MDFAQIIRELVEEKRRLDEAIRVLEGVASARGTSIAKRRGRKGMSAEERAQVSARMKRYWAARRAKARK